MRVLKLEANNMGNVKWFVVLRNKSRITLLILLFVIFVGAEQVDVHVGNRIFWGMFSVPMIPLYIFIFFFPFELDRNVLGQRFVELNEYGHGALDF